MTTCDDNVLQFVKLSMGKINRLIQMIQERELCIHDEAVNVIKLHSAFGLLVFPNSMFAPLLLFFLN